MYNITSLASANCILCTKPPLCICSVSTLSTSAVCLSALSLFGGITNCSSTYFTNMKKQDVLIFAPAQEELSYRAGPWRRKETWGCRSTETIKAYLGQGRKGGGGQEPQ